MDYPDRGLAEDQCEMGGLDGLNATKFFSPNACNPSQNETWRAVPAGGAAPSMGQVLITIFGCEVTVLVVAATGVLVAGVGMIVVEGTHLEALVNNDIIVMVAVSDFVVVGVSTSMGGVRGNGVLNSG
uniref:Uncharacterized protein n=1 Tax=Romanomermis culicivorax TaxID=13658 RepID=A0A915JIC7_ROMCU